MTFLEKKRVYDWNVENLPFKEREEIALVWMVRDYLGLSNPRYEEYKSYMDWYEENRGREDYLNFPKMLSIYFAKVNWLTDEEKLEFRGLLEV